MAAAVVEKRLLETKTAIKGNEHRGQHSRCWQHGRMAGAALLCDEHIDVTYDSLQRDFVASKTSVKPIVEGSCSISKSSLSPTDQYRFGTGGWGVQTVRRGSVEITLEKTQANIEQISKHMKVVEFNSQRKNLFFVNSWLAICFASCYSILLVASIMVLIRVSIE